MDDKNLTCLYLPFSTYVTVRETGQYEISGETLLINKYNLSWWLISWIVVYADGSGMA